VLNIQTAGTTAIAIDASQNATFTNGANLPNTFGFKNRIINGAMVIDQRNAGTAVTADGSFVVDRFVAVNSTDGTFSGQQVSDAPSGFINSLKWTTTAADTSLSAGQYTSVRQFIEGLNLTDLAWGTASAATVTLSFWVKSSLTGTFSGALANSAYNRSYPFNYTISSANTWEQKTITIAGDTSGTWLTTNGIGIRLYMSLGAGSNFTGTASAWNAAGYTASTTGATSVIGTLNATWQITGVQLEKGSTATSFDYRPYGTELALCQRYCVVFANNSTNDLIPGLGTGYSSTHTLQMVPLPVTTRTSTGTVSFTGSWSLGDGQIAIAVTNIASGGTGGNCIPLDFTVASGITIYRPYYVYAASPTAKIITSWEL
jgi:hypothetical protein